MGQAARHPRGCGLTSHPVVELADELHAHRGVGAARSGRTVAGYRVAMGRTDIATRRIDVDVDVVYSALVDPASLVAWLPPTGMSATLEHFDLRPGGSYRLVLTYDDPIDAPGKSTDDSDVVEARFVDLVPGERVVQAVDFVSDDPTMAGTMTMTWSVAPDEGGTLVELRADDVPSGISAEDHAEGMTSSLANLAAHLE